MFKNRHSMFGQKLNLVIEKKLWTTLFYFFADFMVIFNMYVTKLDLSQWAVVLVGSFAMIVIVEIVKFIQRKLGMDKNAI